MAKSSSDNKIKQYILTNEDLVEIFSSKFNQEWDGYTVVIPYSQAFKKQGEPINILNIPRLSNNPNGDNLYAACLELIQLEDALNSQINTINNNFIATQGIIPLNQQGLIHPQQNDLYGRYKTSIEIFAYIMKTTIDKMICLVSVSNYGYKKDGGIKHDSIGSLIDKNGNRDIISNKIRAFAGGTLIEHYKFLYKLNNIHNAYKHTFSTTQVKLTDTITPTMFVIYKYKNTTNTPSKAELMLCYKAVQEFESVLKTMLTALNNRML